MLSHFPEPTRNRVPVQWYGAGRVWARAVGRDVALAALRSAVATWSGRWTNTFWRDVDATRTGTAETRGSGKQATYTMEEHANLRAKESMRIESKGEALTLAHAVSKYGGSSDAECLGRFGVLLDDDTDKDGLCWERLRALLDEINLSYIAQRRPEAGKNHIEVPFTAS